MTGAKPAASPVQTFSAFVSGTLGVFMACKVN